MVGRDAKARVGWLLFVRTQHRKVITGSRYFSVYEHPATERTRPPTILTTPLADKVSETLERATYAVIVDAPVPRWRRVIRKIQEWI